tara:strand:+ start:56 stop:832 length:777 start_codon:yes stop_codon:yes gene_type:complete
MDLKVILTGASRGIGNAIATHLITKKLVKEIHLVGSSNKIFDVFDKYKDLENISIIPNVVDLGDPENVTEFCNQLGTLKSKPNAIINCAGILGPNGLFDSLNCKSYEKVFNINVFAPLMLISALSSDMKYNNFGRIINFAGGGAAYSYPNFMPYSLSKVSVVRMTENIAKEFSDNGYENILSNVIAPGAVETDMLKAVRKSGGFVKTTVDISEPVRLVEFLLLNENKEINGKFIHSRDAYNDIDFDKNNDFLCLRRID